MIVSDHVLFPSMALMHKLGGALFMEICPMIEH